MSKEKKSNEDLKRQQMLQYQIIQQQVMQLQQQLQLIENNEGELESAKQSIKDMENAKPGSEVLSPVTSGIFVKAELKENKEFLINVGGNVVVSKEPKKVMQLLDDQSKELKKVKEEMMKNLEELAVRAVYIEAEINKSG